MTTFLDMNLKTEVQKALIELGFEKPTPIQDKSIPILLESDRDMLAFAQTGTGKTAAFSLPIIHQIDTSANFVQALVLCPTRELCNQISSDIEKFSKYVPGLKTGIVVGGSDVRSQIQRLNRGVHIVVATPGRAVDLLNRKKLNISQIKWCVLDEADEMLSMGFKDELNAILAESSDDKQVLLFSATMSKDIMKIAHTYMNKPHEVAVAAQNTSSANVEHHLYVTHARDRYEALRRIVDTNPGIYGIVFCRTREETKTVAQYLARDNYSVDAIHGELPQTQRERVMKNFRAKNLQILVATDVAARGLDVADLTHVINYNLPDDVETYVHRSGRTGRAGKQGLSIALVHMRENGKIRAIEKKMGKTFIKKLIPSADEVCEKRLLTLIDTVKNVPVDLTRVQKLMPAIYDMFAGMDKEELINHFVSVEFNNFLEYYKNAKDLNVAATQGGGGRYDSGSRRGGGRDRRGGRDSGRGRDRGGDFTWVRINLGEKDGLTAPDLMGLLNTKLGASQAGFGKITIRKINSSFQIESSFAEKVAKACKGLSHGGRDIWMDVERSGGPSKQRRDRRRRNKK